MTSTEASDAGAIMSVHGTARRTPRAELGRLADALDRHPELGDDPCAATSALEARAATLLGKQSALFLPTGKMAQQIALRIHADRQPGRPSFLAHPTNHLAAWEDESYAVLHGLHCRVAGDPNELLTAEAIQAALDERVSTVLWELPQREIGGQLPSWDQLQAQLQLVREHGAATHLDGARLWQAGPWYERPLSEICAGFDSVYVSLYKDLEAPRGALLLGDSAFIAIARVWSQRLGGTIDEAWPLALLGLDGLETRNARMPEYLAHARAVAAAISEHTAASVCPDPPQAPLFHVHLPLPHAAAERAHDRLLAGGALRLAWRFRSNPDPRRCSIEMTVGESALALDPASVADAINELVRDGGGGGEDNQASPR
jgi:threonine aldolase